MFLKIKNNVLIKNRYKIPVINNKLGYFINISNKLCQLSFSIITKISFSNKQLMKKHLFQEILSELIISKLIFELFLNLIFSNLIFCIFSDRVLLTHVFKIHIKSYLNFVLSKSTIKLQYLIVNHG